MRLRVSATEVDTYRRYLAGGESWDVEAGEYVEMTLQMLLDRLQRRFEPSLPMLAGSALHKALELTEGGDFESLECNGFTFIFNFDATLDLPTIRECKAWRDYEVDGDTVTLVGMVDAIDGRRVDDHKLASQFDSESFLDSYQWRIYLEIFDADQFRWNVFEGRAVEGEPVNIRAFHPLTIYRYPGMAEDVARQVQLFHQFARQYLPERFTQGDR